MPLDSAVKIKRVFHSTRFTDDGGVSKTLVYEFSVGRHGPFREEFFPNEQAEADIHHRLNMQARLLRETGALTPEGA